MNINIQFQIAMIVKYFLRTVYLLLLLRFIFSWINYRSFNSYQIRKTNAIEKFVLKLTDPIVGPFEGMFPNMRIDFSPLIVFLILNFFIEPLVFKVVLGF